MYVCMYVYIYTYIHTYIYLSIYILTYIAEQRLEEPGDGGAGSVLGQEGLCEGDPLGNLGYSSLNRAFIEPS